MSSKGSKRKEENSKIDLLLADMRGKGVEVFFSHFKIGDEEYYGYCTIAVAVRYVPKIATTLAATLVGEENAAPEGLLSASIINAGWSFCSPKDIFRASRGRLGAVRRLISRQVLSHCLDGNVLPKKEIKFLAEGFLQKALIGYPPPWYAKANSPMIVKRVCLCGPKRAKQYTL